MFNESKDVYRGNGRYVEYYQFHPVLGTARNIDKDHHHHHKQ